MEVAVFGTRPHDRRFLGAANAGRHQLRWLEPRLTLETAPLADGAAAVVLFVNDHADAPALQRLKEGGVRLVALRSAGFNQVDLRAADGLGLTVARVPAYSPHAVAEHSVALILTLNRRIHRAYNRVREGNFSLDGLMGFDLYGRTAGIVGTGEIGRVVARILEGFGLEVLGHDPRQAPNFPGRYVELDELWQRSDIITLHCPLTPETHHLVNAQAIGAMKPGVMIVNTSRGAVVDTRALIDGLKSGKVGHVALDVYEEEADLFFEDLSDQVLHDDVFARLLTFPNVLITGHQAFFTEEALSAIAETTMANISSFEATGRPVHPVSVERLARG